MISVCVYFSTKPFTPVQVQWNTCGSASHCMCCSGQSTSVTVTTAGLSCTAIGKVESKSSSSGGDVCATDKSYWELSYDAGVYSGGCVSRWIGGGSSHNYIEFVNGKYSPGTSVCGSQAACPGTQTDWDAGTAPNIYVSYFSGVAERKVMLTRLVRLPTRTERFWNADFAVLRRRCLASCRAAVVIQYGSFPSELTSRVGIKILILLRRPDRMRPVDVEWSLS